MKKILTIAVAVILTLAMAIPAFADIGWPAPDKAAAKDPTLIDPTLKLTQLEYEPSLAAGAYNANGIYFKAYNTSVCVVKCTDVRWMVELTVPEWDFIKVDEIDKEYFEFVMTTTNLKPINDGELDDGMYTGYWDNYTEGVVDATKTNGDFDINDDDADDDIYVYTADIAPLASTKSAVEVAKYTMMFTSSVVNTAKACVNVNYSCGQRIADIAIAKGGIQWYNDKAIMTAVRLDDGNYVVSGDTKVEYVPTGKNCAEESATLPYVMFKVDAKSKIIGIAVSPDNGAHFYDAAKDVNYLYTFANLPDTVDPAMVAKFLDYVLDSFGWTWKDCIASQYMYDCAKVNGVKTGYCAMLNVYDWNVTACWNPYTATLTCTDGVKPPQTGDATTVVGFVMIALALVAAAAVVVKKVRA